jgi:hypothetical protein
MRDGKVLDADPAGLMGYVAVPFGKWSKLSKKSAKRDLFGNGRGENTAALQK